MDSQATALRRKSFIIVPAERRAFPRYRLTHAVFCHFASVTHKLFGTAKVLDISQGGMRLLLSHRLKVGAEVTVELSNVARGVHHQVPLRVVRVHEQAGGGYTASGKFAQKLTTEELQKLLT